MWIIYALTTVIFYAGLDFFVKKAAGRIDDFLGTVIINFFSTLPALVVYTYLKLSNQQILFTKEGAIASVIAGLSIGVGTITLLKMFSLGTNISLGSPIVRIGTVVLTTLIGVLLLKETLEPRQLIGLILSMIGLSLIIFK